MGGQRALPETLGWRCRVLGRPALSGGYQVLFTFDTLEQASIAKMALMNWYKTIEPTEPGGRDWYHYSVRYFVPSKKDVRMAMPTLPPGQLQVALDTLAHDMTAQGQLYHLPPNAVAAQLPTVIAVPPRPPQPTRPVPMPNQYAFADDRARASSSSGPPPTGPAPGQSQASSSGDRQGRSRTPAGGGMNEEVHDAAWANYDRNGTWL